VDASPPRPWAPDVLHPYPAAPAPRDPHGHQRGELFYGHLHPAAASGHHDQHGCRAGGLIYDAVYLPAGTHTQCGPWAEPAGPSYNGGGLHGTVSFGVRTAPQLYGGLPTSLVGPGFLFRASGFELPVTDGAVNGDDVWQALASWGRWNSGPRTRATATCRPLPRRSGRRRCGCVGLSPPGFGHGCGQAIGLHVKVVDEVQASNLGHTKHLSSRGWGGSLLSPSLRAGHLVSRRVRGRLGLGVWGGGGVVFYLGEPGGIGGLRPGLVASGLGWGDKPSVGTARV
jgi:hypothetical protein